MCVRRLTPPKREHRRPGQGARLLQDALDPRRVLVEPVDGAAEQVAQLDAERRADRRGQRPERLLRLAVRVHEVEAEVGDEAVDGEAVEDGPQRVVGIGQGVVERRAAAAAELPRSWLSAMSSPEWCVRVRGPAGAACLWGSADGAPALRSPGGRLSGRAGAAGAARAARPRSPSSGGVPELAVGVAGDRLALDQHVPPAGGPHPGQPAVAAGRASRARTRLGRPRPYRELGDDDVRQAVVRPRLREDPGAAADRAPVADADEHGGAVVDHAPVDRHAQLPRAHPGAGDDGAQRVRELAEAGLPPARGLRRVRAEAEVDDVHHQPPLPTSRSIGRGRPPGQALRGGQRVERQPGAAGQVVAGAEGDEADVEVEPVDGAQPGRDAVDAAVAADGDDAVAVRLAQQRVELVVAALGQGDRRPVAPRRARTSATIVSSAPPASGLATTRYPRVVTAPPSRGPPTRARGRRPPARRRRRRPGRRR